jgi:transposase
MGTSPERVLTDKLGRRSGPRRKYSVAEKRSMVEETRQPGASVPEVAQRHGVNANLLSVWRRLERQGTLIEVRRSRTPALLPVQVTTPTLLPTERAVAPPPPAQTSSATIEVDFGSGRRLRVLGPFDATVLRELVSALTSR